MQDPGRYQLEDLLSNAEFRDWALGKTNAGMLSQWSLFYNDNPDIRPVMDQAKEMLQYISETDNQLSERDMQQQISQILADTAPAQNSVTHRLWPLTNWKKAAVAASIALLLVCGAGIMVYVNNHHAVSAGELITSVDKEMIRVSHQVPGTKKIELPDHSRITLHAGAALEYPKDFGTTESRKVYLTGKAFFEVQKDATRPFLVYANGLLTRVVGTSFQVETTNEGTDVQVLTGKVAVMPLKGVSDAKAADRQLLLTPNQAAHFSARQNTLSKEIVKQPTILLEENNKPDFNFANQSVPQVFARLQEVYGISILYDKAAMKACRVHVVLGNEPFFTKLDIICKTIGASYDMIDGQIIVSSDGCQ